MTNPVPYNNVNKISAMHAPSKMRIRDLFNNVYYYTPEEVAKFINDAFETGRRYEAGLVKSSPAQTQLAGKQQSKPKTKPQVKFNAQTSTKKPAPAKAPAKKNNNKPNQNTAKPKAK